MRSGQVTWRGRGTSRSAYHSGTLSAYPSHRVDDVGGQVVVQADIHLIQEFVVSDWDTGVPEDVFDWIFAANVKGLAAELVPSQRVHVTSAAVVNGSFRRPAKRKPKVELQQKKSGRCGAFTCKWPCTRRRPPPSWWRNRRGWCHQWRPTCNVGLWADLCPLRRSCPSVRSSCRSIRASAPWRQPSRSKVGRWSKEAPLLLSAANTRSRPWCTRTRWGTSTATCNIFSFCVTLGAKKVRRPTAAD